MNSSFTESNILDKAFYSVRSVFYLLKPSETYFENTQDAPDLTKQSANVFFSFILIEQLISIAKNGKFNGKINDGVTSVSAGVISTLPKILFRNIHLSTYEWCYENLKIYELPYDSVWTFMLAFLFIDMMYYWFHRAAHEVNVFWAAHQTHHSSEEYNLTSALRQSIFQNYTSWMFYLPLALFVRPSIFLVHSHLNILYQFWIHTELVDNIGPLEHVLNTPSHHRVHHGRNPYCIDKNYAGVLIIWDKLFGTFEAEKKNVKIAYGLVHPIQTFNPIYIQVFNYEYIIKRFFECKCWSERFSVLFKGPGWVNGSPRLGFANSIPEVEEPIKKYNVNISPLLNIYVALHFAFILVMFSLFVLDIQKYTTLWLSFSVLLLIYNFTCFGLIFDAKPNAFIFEAIRCLLIIGCDHFYGNHLSYLLYGSKLIYLFFKWFNILSFILAFYIGLHKFALVKDKQVIESKSN